MSLKHTTIYFLRFNGLVYHLSKSIINLIYFSITSQYRKCIEIASFKHLPTPIKDHLPTNIQIIDCRIFILRK